MRGTYGGYWLAYQLSQLLPYRAAFRLAQACADVRWRFATLDRRIVTSNLRAVLGPQVSERSAEVREVFRHFGRTVVEFFCMHRVAHPEVRLEGGEHVTEAHRQGRGVIALTAHLGNWELGAVTLRRLGLSVSAVALPHEDPSTDQLFNRQRLRCGIGVIPLGAQALRRSLQVLRQGQVLGLLGDRDFQNNGMAVAFCQRQLMMPRGPAVVSLRSGAPVVPSFLIREGRWTFRLLCEPAIWPSRQGGPEAISRLTRQYAQVMERYVQRFPTQWLMFQPLAPAGIPSETWPVTA